MQFKANGNNLNALWTFGRIRDIRGVKRLALPHSTIGDELICLNLTVVVVAVVVIVAKKQPQTSQVEIGKGEKKREILTATSATENWIHSCYTLRNIKGLAHSVPLIV